MGIARACRDGQTSKLLDSATQRANQSLLIYSGRNPFDAAEASDLLSCVLVGLLIVASDAELQVINQQMERMKETTPAATIKRAKRMTGHIDASGTPDQLELDLFPRLPLTLNEDFSF